MSGLQRQAARAPRGYSFGWSADAGDIGEAQGVREEVFCREQGVSLAEELDGLDGRALHLLVRREETGEVVATLRLLLDGGVARVGRVAVLWGWRRRGIARCMLELAVARARELGARRVRLAAQLDALELYRLAGFTVESEVFEEAGIDHVWMGRELSGD